MTFRTLITAQYNEETGIVDFLIINMETNTNTIVPCSTMGNYGTNVAKARYLPKSPVHYQELIKCRFPELEATYIFKGRVII